MDKNRCFLDSRIELKRPRSSMSRQSLNCNRERVKDLSHNCKFYGLSKRMLSVISSDRVGESDKIVPLFITYRVVGHSPSG